MLRSVSKPNAGDLGRGEYPDGPEDRQGGLGPKAVLGPFDPEAGHLALHDLRIGPQPALRQALYVCASVPVPAFNEGRGGD